MKGKRSIILLALLSIILIGGSVFVLTRGSSEKDKRFVAVAQKEVSEEERRVLARYRNEKYGFEIQYPDGLRPAYKPGEGELSTITFQESFSEDAINNGFWFEMVVDFYEGESVAIGKDFIKEFIDTNISGLSAIRVGDNIDGVTFTTSSDDMRHVWFIHEGILYRLKAPRESGTRFSDVIATIIFINDVPAHAGREQER